jgi:hypothetical protein
MRDATVRVRPRAATDMESRKMVVGGSWRNALRASLRFLMLMLGEMVRNWKPWGSSFMRTASRVVFTILQQCR